MNAPEKRGIQTEATPHEIPGSRYGSHLSLVGAGGRKVPPTMRTRARDSIAADGPELAPKMQTCSEMLREGKRLVLAGRFERQLNQIVLRSSDILDEVDETLIALDPIRDVATFAFVARLHRDLEQIQAAIAELRRTQSLSAQDAE